MITKGQKTRQKMKDKAQKMKDKAQKMKDKTQKTKGITQIANQRKYHHCLTS